MIRRHLCRSRHKGRISGRMRIRRGLKKKKLSRLFKELPTTEILELSFISQALN